MTQVIGIAGSLRRDSYNAALLRAALEFVPEGDKLDIESIHAIPLYNYDVEIADFPAQAALLKDRIAAADGLLIVTPEYNNAIPGVAKNAIDWLTRPPDDIPRVFANKPVAIIGASPGRFGTILSQNAWLPVLRTLGTRPWFGGRLQVSQAAQMFDAEGRLTNDMVRDLLRKFIEGFFEFASRAND
ncbi:MAG TPA: NADPH-dependent FMN reductase [Oleiagrimonas sp.]|nr:NADPH-dependent FMN reductase [Oleiagrimonas sp.]